MQSLIDRIKDHKISQIHEYQDAHSGKKFPGYLDAAYIVRKNRYYSTFLVVQDVVVSA